MARYFRRPVTMIKVAIAVFAALASPVRADAIDGSWCTAEGDNLQINGQSIVTPGGRKITGSYSRHAFSYVSPEGEMHEGETLDMILQSDELMNMRLPDGNSQQWRRCEVVS